MRIKIRVVKDFSIEELDKLDKLGIKVNLGWDDFEINDNDPKIHNIQDILNESEWENISETKASFSESDRENAPFLNIYSNKMLGYAKPDGDEVEVDNFPYPFDLYPYYKGVVEIANTDNTFGMLPGKQIGLYSLDGEAKWGKKDIASANFIEDIFFVKPEIYEEIFRPLNIKSLPVLNYKTKEPLKSVVQIVQQGISPYKLNINDKKHIKEVIYIEQWDLKKIVLRADTYYPSFINTPQNIDFFYTQEYFGDGSDNQRNTIISQKLYQILKKYNIKGLNYYPMDK